MLTIKIEILIKKKKSNYLLLKRVYRIKIFKD